MMPSPSQPKLGLALGSGGWKGLAHIGVIKSLVRHGYQISSIAGSSAGALIGGLYALSLDIDQIEALFVNLTYKDILFAFSDPSIKRGIFQGKKTLSFIEKLTKKANFTDTLIPFRAVATNIITGKPYIFKDGSLATAIRASSSIPIVFEPIAYENMLLVDGGVSNPVPVDIVKSLTTDTIIAVNLYQSAFPIKKPIKKITQLDIGIYAYELMLNHLSHQDCQNADILIEPPLALQLDPLYRIENCLGAIKCGQVAMDARIPLLKQKLS